MNEAKKSEMVSLAICAAIFYGCIIVGFLVTFYR